jgi:hypothetical protein
MNVWLGGMEEEEIRMGMRRRGEEYGRIGRGEEYSIRYNNSNV